MAKAQKTEQAKPFSIGALVEDRNGYKGRIVNVTHYNGTTWYDVRFPAGVAVRYYSDLKPQ